MPDSCPRTINGDDWARALIAARERRNTSFDRVLADIARHQVETIDEQIHRFLDDHEGGRPSIPVLQSQGYLVQIADCPLSTPRSWFIWRRRHCLGWGATHQEQSDAGELGLNMTGTLKFIRLPIDQAPEAVRNFIASLPNG